MPTYFQKVKIAAEYLKQDLRPAPEIAILTGTGLGFGNALLEKAHHIDYQHIPHFPRTTVTGHQGRLHHGEVNSRSTIVLEGRFHLYEGYSPQEVVFPVRVLRGLGVRVLIVTNAAGGLDAAFQPGDVMLISDHINLIGANPLLGANVDAWGPRFPDMHQAYNARLGQLALEAARHQGLKLQKGVYAGLRGPSLETPAEVRYLQIIGAQAVGFSTVMEVIAAVHAGMRVLGISCLTNVHDPDNPAPASIDEILRTAGRVAPAIMQLMGGIIERL